MKALVTIAACITALSCGRTLTVYHRTSPRDVVVERDVSQPELFAFAMRRDASIDVHFKRERRVRLHRVMQYNALAVIYDHSHSVWVEASEMLLALLALATIPTIPAIGGLGSGIEGTDTETRKVVRRRGWLAGLFDPTTSVIQNNIRTEPVVPEQIFSAPSTVRAYDIRVPVPDVKVAFRVLDDAGIALAAGQSTADSYGELRIDGAFERAVAVEIAVPAEGAVLVVPLETPVAADPPRVDPAMLRVAADTTLINEGWARRHNELHILPRVALTVDVARLRSLEGWMLGEIRVLPTLSVAGIAGREAVSWDSLNGPRHMLVTSGGGSLRWYAFGHFGTGLHVGIEALYGLGDDTAQPRKLKLTSYGPTLGYKYTFNCGLTAEFVVVERLMALDDPATGWRELDGVLLRVDLGWSF